MTPIRIAITRMPRLLREIVEETVANEADMRIVDAPVGDRDLATFAREEDAHVVVTNAEPTSALLAQAFAARPGLRLIVLDHAGGRSVLHELRPERVPLGDASPERLIAVIREHASRQVTLP